MAKMVPWTNLQKMKLRKQKPSPSVTYLRFLLQNLLKMTKLGGKRGQVGSWWGWRAGSGRDEGSGRELVYGRLRVCPCHHPGVDGALPLAACHHGSGIKAQSVLFLTTVFVNLPHLKI